MDESVVLGLLGLVVLVGIIVAIVATLASQGKRRQKQHAGLEASVSFGGLSDESVRPAKLHQGSIQFSPSDSVLQPIELRFEVGELPQKKTTAPGGRYGAERDKYQLDLGQAQCSCGGWQQRKRYPLGDPRRLCRHLVVALRRQKFVKGTDEWSQAVIDNGEGVPLQAWIARLETAPDALITNDGSDDWLNVFAHEKKSGERIADASGPISRWGWSITETRWAGGTGIPGARELRDLLKDAVI